MVVSHFRVRTVPESSYLKSVNFATDLLSPFFLGSHRSPILTYNVIALLLAILLSHMFYLAFAELNDLFITRANFEDHIIKFGRLQFVERKIVEYKCKSLNIKMSTVEHKCESSNINVNRK